MAAPIVVRAVTVEPATDGTGDMLRIVYDLPGEPASDPGKDRHVHYASVHAVHVRMAAYGISKTEALEEVLLERVTPDLDGTWPRKQGARDAARKQRDVASVRRFADLVPDPDPDVAATIKGRLTRSGPR